MRGAVAVSESAIPVPRQAIAVMFGTEDRAEGYAIQPDGSFYVDGSFDVRLPPGTYTLAISKGFEYLRETQTIELKPGSFRNARVQAAPLGGHARARLVFGRRSHTPAPLPRRRSRHRAVDRGGRHPRGQPAAHGRFLGDVLRAVRVRRTRTLSGGGTPAFPRAGGAAHPGNRPHHFAGRERLCAQPAGLLFVRQALRPRARAGRRDRDSPTRRCLSTAIAAWR